MSLRAEAAEGGAADEVSLQAVALARQTDYVMNLAESLMDQARVLSTAGAPAERTPTGSVRFVENVLRIVANGRALMRC